MTTTISGSTGITTNGVVATGAPAFQFPSGQTLGAGNATGFKNRIINGAMTIDQRNGGAAQTLTAGVSAYTVDRWLGYCAGANVTGQQVSNGAGGYNYQYTGAAGVTAINHIQRIESKNSADLAGSTATLSLNLSNSLLTTVTWTAYYANATDNFSSNTQIATGTFTVNSSISSYSAQIAIPSAATTGIQITLAVGSQTSGTWVIGKVQLEVGSTATSFDVRDYGREIVLCKRYYRTQGIYWQGSSAGLGQGQGWTWYFESPMRAVPTITFSNVTSGSGSGTTSPQAVDGCGLYGIGNGNGAYVATTTASAEL